MTNDSIRMATLDSCAGFFGEPLLPPGGSTDTRISTEVRTMLGMLTMVAAVVVMGVGCSLAWAVKEYGRRHPDPAWKPTGYRVR
jgi:hypothetical protein